jgi:enterochelin esterase-like enzyme
MATREATAPVPPLPAAWAPGTLHALGPFAVPGLAARQVRVYLPSDYDPGTPRDALYLFDGQNVFDDGPSYAGGWHVHTAVERRVERGRPAPVVVGIDHGGRERISELSPFDFRERTGRLELLLDWIVGGLMPALAAALALVPGAAGAVAGGSSMGGLAALYAHFRHPEAFGGALSMSPSFWVADGEILRWVAEQPVPETSRVYLDGGAREDRGGLLPLVAAMAAHLANRGYDADRLMFRPDARGAHYERSWSRRTPKALRFFYG